MSTALNRRVGWTLASLGTLASLVAIFVPSNHAKGELWFFGFGTVAVPYLFGLLGSPNRRHEISMGIYMLVAAFAFGRPLLWQGSPGWVQTSLFTAFMLAVAWNIFESMMQTRARAIAASRGTFLARRTPAQLAMLVVALGVLIAIAARFLDSFL
jgi:hypothetical protein